MGLLELPRDVLEDIINRLEDAKHIAIIRCVSKDFYDAGSRVRTMGFVVLDEYHERLNDNAVDFAPRWKIKDQIVQIMKGKECIEQLHIHTHPKLQAKTVSDDSRGKTDLWLSDPRFLTQCLLQVKSTLEHLCIVDYGQQAILRRSSIIKILSQNCKRLKTLDLRNMFIDTSECEEMPSMVGLTWRCVKVTGGALEDINNIMPKLQTLALLGVFGVERGNLSFVDMKVLCLGLSTPAKDIVMNLPKVEKLQLKMQCPKKLIINAPMLKYVAFNLEVLDSSIVELKCIAGVRELLYGASSILTLSNLVEKNLYLKKIFLDIPCMALGEDGRFLGVLKDVALMLPNFSKLQKCGALEVLNIGPGLFYSLDDFIGPCAQQALDLPCITLLRDGRYLDMLDDEPIFIPSFSELHECNNLGVSYTPLGRVQTHYMWPIPDGLNLRMSESEAQ